MTDEDHFLHDIATPLATLTMLLESVVELAQEAQGADSKLVNYAQKSMKSALKMGELVNARRTVLAKQAPKEKDS